MILKDRAINVDTEQGEAYFMYQDGRAFTVIRLGDTYITIDDEPQDAYEHPVIYVNEHRQKYDQA